ncbi:response regulator [Shewanella sp. VB17]|uniref:response regulator n=1 Tax=Shewanella sp. VB17 TaxID=2739432 RepID=UPI001564861A|nr:response regulator [Shewanella sp. VB17]NRD75617.1 response regulator [Shewanella sp. VB17]
MSTLLPSELSILLLEASDTQRKIISSKLSEEGFSNIQTATTVSEALDIINHYPPDLVTSAMHFEDGTALTILKEIKENKNLEDIQFMLVSSECRREQLEVYRQAGVVAILPKPFSSEHLLKALNSTLDLLNDNELELSHFDVHELKVLVVDDSKLARNIIKRTIAKMGLKLITEAEDGAQAIEIMKDNQFDLVITDYNMPSVDGLALTQFIRNDSQQCHVPILMVSSEANDTHLANVAQAGVNALCDKPFEPMLVKQLLYQLLND